MCLGRKVFVWSAMKICPRWGLATIYLRIPDWRVMGSNAARLTPGGWVGLEDSEGAMPYCVEIQSICVEIALIFMDA